MSKDRELVNVIKQTFAEYSSAQLAAIAESKDTERWSAEALVAAGEVLRDRAAGRAKEPLCPKEPEPPPCYHYEPENIPLSVLGGLFLGFLFIPYTKVGDADTQVGCSDRPLAFGSNLAWIALDTVDTAAVARALGLQETRSANWEQGIAAAYQSSVFVTPTLGYWTLAASTSLFPPEQAAEFVKPVLERLSQQFGDAQYFCTHQEIGLYLWARAQDGQLIRAFGLRGEKDLPWWEEGSPTAEERDLIDEVDGKQFLSELSVCELASIWSVDPTAMNEQLQLPDLGILGRLPGSPGAGKGSD